MSGLFDKGPDNVTTTTNTTPWYAQQPYLRDLFGEAKRLYEDPTIGQIAPFTPDQLASFNLTRERALAGSPAFQAAESQIARTAGGDFIGANPYLDAAFGRAADRTSDAYTRAVNRTTGGFSAGGRLGSGAYAAARNDLDTALGDTLNDLATSIYGGAYRAERSNALQAAGMAPQIAASGYLDADRLAGIGGQQQQLGQAVLDNPYRRLAQFQGGISGNYGGTSSSTQPVFNDPLGSVLGVGTTLAGLGWSPFSK